jgi:hypothetical protein
MAAVTSSASGERSNSKGGTSVFDQAGQTVLTTDVRPASPSITNRGAAAIIKHLFFNLVFPRFPTSPHGRLEAFEGAIPADRRTPSNPPLLGEIPTKLGIPPSHIPHV